MLKYAGDELTHVLFADTFNQTFRLSLYCKSTMVKCREENQMSRSISILAMGEGDVDFDGIFETLREMDFANTSVKSGCTKSWWR